MEIVNRPSATPGICRIDQPHKHNHGFFVRIARRGKIHTGFFPDKAHGGKEQALAAAQTYYQKLAAKLGTPVQHSRLYWSEIKRRPGRRGIVGVRRVVSQRDGRKRVYWMAAWSPEYGVVTRRVFSIRRYGALKARQLAIRARRAGLRKLK